MSPIRQPLSRRAVLRGAGGVAIALPFLEAMAPRRAQAAAGIRRLFIFANENGVVDTTWFPTGDEKTFTLGASMASLEPFKKNLILIDGCDAMGRGGTAHERGRVACLTGHTGSGGVSDGISVDQEVASHIGDATPLRSIVAGVRTRFDSYHFFTKGPRQVLLPEDDPRKIYSMMFDGGFTPPAAGAPAAGPSAAELARLRLRKKSVLDSALEEYRQLATRVGTADQKRLQVHADAIRQIEHRLDALATRGTSTSAGCAKPAAPTITPDGNDYQNLGKAQLDLLCLALACDLTRVVAMQWKTSQTAFTWLGSNTLHHPLSHQGGNAAADMQLTRIMDWHAAQAAYVLGKLEAMNEGDGSVLDSTLFHWTNELATGPHRQTRAPYLLAAGRFPLAGGGTLQTGRSLRFNGLPNVSVLQSILEIFGIDSSNFGLAEWRRGPLPGLI